MRYSIIMLLVAFALNLYWEVFATSAQEEPLSQADFMVEAFVTNDRPFVGEQIEYVFRFRAHQRPPDLTDELPGFDGFWLVEIADAGDLGVETIDGRQFFVGERRVILSPMQEGAITIEPATLVLPETVFREGARFSTSPITICVQPLPPGAPAAFTGAVGQFHAETTIDQTSVTVGQPITLTMVVTGTGNLESLRAPKLDFPGGWRVYTNPSRYSADNVSGLRVGEKTFEWLVIPEQTGTLMFPEVTFAFFNPQTGEYHSLVQEPITVGFLPGNGSSGELTAFDPGEIELPPLTLKPVPNKLNADSPGPGIVLWVLWGIAPFLPVSCAGWIYGRRYQMRRQLAIRRSTALRRASKRLRSARKRPRLEASERITGAIQGYLVDKFGRTIRSLDQTSIVTVLAERQITSEMIGALLDSLKQVEAMRYMPDELEMDVESVIKQALATLAQLDEIWMAS